jgi:methyl-accepting chemotaxis protein
MPIGKKLYLSFGAAFALSIALGVTALFSISNLSALLHAAVTSTAQKQQLAGSLSAAASEMLAADRGILVRSYMKDVPAMEKYNRDFDDENAAANLILDKLEPLLVRPEAKHLTAHLRILNGQIEEANKTVYDLAVKGESDAAAKAYADKFLPVQAEMKPSAARLSEIQEELFKEAILSADSSSTGARWITGVMLLLAALVGIAVIVVVMQINKLLRQSVVELSESVGQIASAATEIATSSQGMAQGASEQAATIEETSASSSEINSMAQRNTENSRTTADMMSSSQERFVETNQSLQQMVAAMDGITASSQKISKIIKVIDEIAFQTNILALNAAVEAARAGEAGMGFAVVADEVRSLAQRCAQAAKDTADLIEDSIQKSNGGKTKVDEVAGAFQLVTSESSKMKVLVDEINLGSIEQARGIDQISKSISQMEQVTQSSAANAEEGAAAAEQLSAQAQTMQEIVSRLTSMVDGASNHTVMRRVDSVGTRRAGGNVGRVAVATFKSAVSFPSPKPSLRTTPASSVANFPMDGDFKDF